MSRSPLCPFSQRLLPMLTTMVAATAAPALALAQDNAAAEVDPPAHVSAEEMTGRPDRELFLERDVEVIRGPTTINADRAKYDIIDDRVEAYGNVRMRRFGDTYTGDELKLKNDTGQGYVLNPTYRLERNNAQGDAERIDFETRERATVIDGTYSTCEGPDPDWYLKSSTLDLDRGTDVGVARRSIVFFKGVPILGVPQMSFPLSDARKSGWLPPTIGTSSKGGLEVAVPYYLNIAPNRDLTLIPQIFARRGVQMGAEARYLGSAYSGETRLEFLPNDRLADRNRYALSSIHTQTFGGGFTYTWNLNAASDDNYPNDFPRTITGASQRLLTRDMALSYGSSYWNATARLSNWQILQDPLAPIGRPYDRLPQLNFQAFRWDVGGFDWVTDTELTRFWHPTLVRGNRLVVNPKISYPIIRPGYFITPKFSLHASRYDLENPVPGAARNLSRVLPTFSLDSGLVFERDANFFGQAMTQTLEPRLFYVYTPFRDQSAFPLFDSGLADLTFSQLFSENRFVGHDRISDAHQVTAALISRYIEPSGEERMRLAIGQRYYLNEQRVAIGAVPNETRSDLLLSAYGRISRTLSAETNLQYSQSLHTLNRASAAMRWQPAPKKVLNLQYRRDMLVNKFEQVEASGQWPISSRWYGVGRVNYSLPDRRVAESLGGIEYKADCWVFRIVAQRTPTATGVSSSSLYFQLELNGLARLGSNPLQALETGIPGYQRVNQPNP